jgi:hypothetical protein
MALVLVAIEAYGQPCAAGQNLAVVLAPSSGSLSIALPPTGISTPVTLSFTATANMTGGGKKLYMWAYFPNSTALIGQTYSADIIPTSAVYAQAGSSGSYQPFSAGGPDPWGDTNAVEILRVTDVLTGCQTFTGTLSVEIDMTKVSPAPRAQTFTGTVYVRVQVR